MSRVCDSIWAADGSIPPTATRGPASPRGRVDAQFVGTGQSRNGSSGSGVGSSSFQLSGLMLGALGMLLSSLIKQLENFAGVMNFVIFPMFFASSALYPLWRVQEGSPWLATVCRLNPFTYSVELIRFAFYEQVNWVALGVVAGCTVAFLGGAVIAYDPARGMLMRRGG